MFARSYNSHVSIKSFAFLFGLVCMFALAAPARSNLLDDAKKAINKAGHDVAQLDPNNKNSEAHKAIDHAGKELAKVDPSKAIREELERARKAALSGLRRLDPSQITRQVSSSLQKKLARMAPDPRTGVIDLRRSDMGRPISDFLAKFAQGNKRSSALDELSYNAKIRELVLKCHVRHRQSWGKIIPGRGPVDVYDVTQSAYVKYNFRTNAAEFKIDLGPLAPKIDSRTIERLSDGNIIGALETLTPEIIGKQMHHEEKDEYDAVRNRYIAKYGANNVYFASRDFVKWTTPETVARYIGNGIATLGASVYPQFMADLRKQAEGETPQVSEWLQSRGMSQAEATARQLLSGQQPQSPFLKFEMTPVRYASRNKPLNAVATPWIKIDHIAFVIVWQDGQRAGKSKTKS